MKKIKNKYEKNNGENGIKNVFQPGRFDPFGSYTGLTENGEKPIQDQDDL